MKFRWGRIVLLITLAAASLSGAESAEWSSRVLQLQSTGDTTDAPVATAISLQPNGPLMAVAGDDHTVQVWNRETGEVVHRLAGHQDWVRAVAFLPAGNKLASAGNDRRIILWDAEAGREMRVLAIHEHAISQLVYSPDGSLLATIGFQDMLRIYDAANGRELYSLDCPCRDMRALAFSPDSTIIAAGGRNGKIRFWNAVDGQPLGDQLAHRQRVRAIAFSLDGMLIASCSDDGVIRVADVMGEQSFEMPRSPAKVMSLTFYDDDKLAAGGSDNLIRLWDTAARNEIGQLTGHTGSVVALVSQGGVLVSGSYDTTVRIWKPDANVVASPAADRRRLGSTDLNGLK